MYEQVIVGSHQCMIKVKSMHEDGEIGVVGRIMLYYRKSIVPDKDGAIADIAFIFYTIIPLSLVLDEFNIIIILGDQGETRQ